MTRLAALTALAASIVVATACTTQIVFPPSQRPTHQGTPSPGPTTGIDHPTGATDVVLQMGVGGGLIYPGNTVEQPPEFTLYGDGRVIYSVPSAVVDNEQQFTLRQARLTNDQISSMLEFALGQGALASAKSMYFNDQVYDAGTTRFEIHAAGVDKVVSVYALGYQDENTPDADARRGFAALASRLDGIANDVVAATVVDLGPYEPEAYRITLDRPFGPLQASHEWPWPDLEPGFFGFGDGGLRHRIVTAEQAAAIAEPPMSAPDDFVALGPDGLEYLIRLLPLLPDQLP